MVRMIAVATMGMEFAANPRIAVMANVYFKKDEHLTTFISGKTRSQSLPVVTA